MIEITIIIIIVIIIVIIVVVIIIITMVVRGPGASDLISSLSPSLSASVLER